MPNIRDYFREVYFVAPVGKVIQAERNPVTGEPDGPDAVQFDLSFHAIGRTSGLEEAREMIVTMQVFQVSNGALHIIDTINSGDPIHVSNYSNSPVVLTSYLQGDSRIAVQASVTARDLLTNTVFSGYQVGPYNPLGLPVPGAPKSGSVTANQVRIDPDDPHGVDRGPTLFNNQEF